MISKVLRRNYQVLGGTTKASQRIIDFRSDTVTRPSQKMKDAMLTCALGDDVYEDDPTVNHMQEEMAKFFGKEAALYMPSGT